MHQYASLVMATVCVYTINQAFFFFGFAFQDTVNFDVHPIAGTVGLKSFDHFPLFSAALMVLHKYGIFLLLPFMQLHMASSARPVKSQPVLLPVALQKTLRVHTWQWDNCFIASNIFYFLMSALAFFCLCFSYVSKKHGFQEIVAYTVLTFVIAALSLALSLASAKSWSSGKSS